MSTEVYILTEQQVNKYRDWVIEGRRKATYYVGYQSNGYKEWLSKHPNPLPSPVIVPSDETINEIADNNSFYSSKTALDRLSYYEGIKDGYKALRKHIFGF